MGLSSQIADVLSVDERLDDRQLLSMYTCIMAPQDAAVYSLFLWHPSYVHMSIFMVENHPQSVGYEGAFYYGDGHLLCQ